MSDKCKDIIGNEVNILTKSCQALLTLIKEYVVLVNAFFKTTKYAPDLSKSVLN
jgi:hypothetical protein